jgi:hypothetical protein
MEKKLGIKRYIEDIAFSDKFSRQMRFIAGPRQCGKTTIAIHKLINSKTEQLYYNWDTKKVRDAYRKGEDFFAKDLLDIPNISKFWVCFDEIHKLHKWKNILKDFFDSYQDKVNFIVTGSAKLDVFRKSGDSLAGRYFLFKLNPLILSEFLGKELKDILPNSSPDLFIENLIKGKNYEQEAMEKILKFSGFPEPLLNGNNLFAKKWHDSYLERIVKEDLRDLTSIHNIEKVIDLLYLIPSRIGSPLSINSLKEELELNFKTVKNYISQLNMTYVLFEVPPYTKQISRLVKKEKKIYLYDFSIIESEPARFENFVAMELKARVDLWNDATEERYELCFIKTTDGKETDFLVLRNNTPFFLCEVKLSSKDIERHHFNHAKNLGNIPFIQVVKTSNVLLVKNKNFYVISASRFFA